MTEIHTIDCKNVKCYLIASNNGYLLFDAGWPHQYSQFKDSIKTLGISVKEIKTVVVSHFHMDHAGLGGILTIPCAQISLDAQGEISYTSTHKKRLLITSPRFKP